VTLRRLAVMQWLGLVLGAVVWFTQHILGYGLTEAACDNAGQRWGISNDLWQALLMGVAASLVVAAEIAAFEVFRRTDDTTYEAEPPESRLRFFAIAALPANAIFLVIILLDGFAAIFTPACRGS
jgi:hypothetical protein